jgi:hypothetical protein
VHVIGISEYVCTCMSSTVGDLYISELPFTQSIISEASKKFSIHVSLWLTQGVVGIE